MMSVVQLGRLQQIVSDLRCMSVSWRESEGLNNFSEAECENACLKIEYVIRESDARMASAIIGAWHEGSCKKVVQLVNGAWPRLARVEPHAV